MRLLQLQADGSFSLVNYEGGTQPPYAILSHTWGPDNEEVTFEDLEHGTGNVKAGYQKLVFCSKQAMSDGLQFFWVDTCCIDKKSSSELQEAITSMFQWYRRAAKCYAYLSDVSTNGFPGTYQFIEKSRWFTRGWTLQELLAPMSVEFFSIEGDLLGNKCSLVKEIREITGISIGALQGRALSEFTVDERMRWSERRETKREEDAAYALLGMFNIYMPLLYGEGKENALKRLQRELRWSLEEAVSPFVQGAESRNRTQDERGVKIRRWLSAPDPSTNYLKACKQRQADTGLWLLESKQFTKWKEDAASRLWLYGIPGCGKTVLSSTILQSLLQHCHDSPGSVTLYFYFDFNDAKKQTSDLMLRSLLCQLLQHSITTSGSLDQLFSSCGNGSRQPSLHAILKVIQQTIQRFTHVYIVLDALDECSQRLDLLDTLEIVAGWQLSNLHLLMTSRRERDIEISLESYIGEKDIVSLQSEVVDKDIQRYVQQRMSDDKSLVKWEKDAVVRQEIEAALMCGARGMFRWAVCQLDTLGQCRNRAMLRKALATLPLTLDQTYERILSAIREEDSEYAFRILRWLAFSERPLSVEEVAEIIAIDVARIPAFDYNEVLEDPLEVTNICSSLVTIITTYVGEEEEEEEEEEVKPTRRIVALAHYSVQEYLLSERISQGKARQYSMQAIECHDAIARGCLMYLLQFKGLETCSEEVLQRFMLAEYSARFWTRHARKAGGRLQQISHIALNLFSLDNPAYLIWIQLCDPEQPWEEPDFQKTAEELPAPIYYATLMHLTIVVKLLLDKGANVNAQGGRYNTALQAASLLGSTEVVQLLLDNDGNVNAQGGYYGSAIQAASVCGFEDVVQLLLSNKADVNAQGGEYGNALQAASARNHKNVVQLLLNHDADVNTQGGKCDNALQAASAYGHREVAHLLLNNDANANAQGGHYGNALQAASANGCEDVVHLLLNNKAKVNAQGGHYGNALQAASANGYQDIVHLLLNNDANVNAQGGHYSNALQAASYKGDKEILELLLHNKATIAVPSKSGRTPLNVAADGGHVEIVNSLLEARAYVAANGMDPLYGTIINLLAFQGYTDLLRFVHEHFQADLSLEDSHGRTPLQLAARGGHVDTFQYLIDQGLSCTTLDKNGNGLLCYAASGGSLDILDAALRMGVKSPSKGEHWTPLHWACRGGNSKAIELLSKQGLRSKRVTVSKPEGEWSPLDIAIFHRKAEMAEKLSPYCKSLLSTESNTTQLHGEVHRGYRCDGCLHEIYGPRFHCLTCSCLDYCFMCEPFLESSHLDHEWKTFSNDV